RADPGPAGACRRGPAVLVSARGLDAPGAKPAGLPLAPRSHLLRPLYLPDACGAAGLVHGLPGAAGHARPALRNVPALLAVPVPVVSAHLRSLDSRLGGMIASTIAPTHPAEGGFV